MTTIFDLFDARPHFRSDKLAMSIRIGLRQERWTFAEYRNAVDSIAVQLLNEYALAPCDRVLICAPNSPRTALALHGIFRAGLVAVPLDAGATSSFIAKVAHETEARALITVDAPCEESPLRMIPLSALRTDAGSGPPNWPAAGDIAEIVYTSGTTGTPKGVVLTHGNIAANVQSILSVVPSNEELRLLSVLPLSHMLEQTVGLAMPLLLGGSVHYAKSRHSPAIRRALKRHEITCMVLVPQVLDLIMAGIEREARNRGGWPNWDTLTRVGRHLPRRLRRVLFRKVIDGLGGNLSFCMCGGARLQPALALAWETLGIRVLEGYGATECAPVIASNTMEKRLPGSVGRVLPGFDLRIGDAGEIEVRGESVFSGYWQNEGATRDAFTEDGWFRTGDLADQDAAGHLIIRGRLKDMIALPSGMNVYCEDVERALSDVAGIDECAVVGAPDAEGNARVHAVVCGDLPDEQIGGAVRTANASLADHQRITAYSRWPNRSLPRTSLLKLKRSEILSSLVTPMTSSPGAKEIRPADPLKALVAEISKADADRIQDGSDLRLDLGFDSLMLVELAGVLEESLGVSMDENQLANTQTFGDLAKAVQAPPILELPPVPPAWPRERLARSLRRLIQRLLVFPAHRLLVSDFRVQGAGHLDRVDGPCLLIANHSSHVDTLSILRALPEERRATTTIAAAADYFFRNRILASLMALSLNLFPFSRRGNIRESLEFCGDLVDCGWSVLIYPEGTRSTTGELLDFKQGIGLLATGLKIPVVPIGVVGGHAILSKGRQFPRRGPVTLTIGAPITIDPESAPDQVTRRLEDSVRSLMTPPAQPGRRQKNEKEHA